MLILGLLVGYFKLCFLLLGWVFFLAVFMTFYLIGALFASPILAVVIAVGLLWGIICGCKNAVKAVRKVHGKGGVA